MEVACSYSSAPEVTKLTFAAEKEKNIYYLKIQVPFASWKQNANMSTAIFREQCLFYLRSLRKNFKLFDYGAFSHDVTSQRPYWCSKQRNGGHVGVPNKIPGN